MIFLIEGPPKSGKSTIANALRNQAIQNRGSALLIDQGNDADIVHLLEKIIDGARFAAGTGIDAIKWKPSPTIILVGDGAERLAQIESLVPGFTKKFGPIQKVRTEGAGSI